MTRWCTGFIPLLSSCVLSLVVSSAHAQQGGAGSNLNLTDQAVYLYVMQAAANPNVQDDLKLTEDQMQKMAEIRENVSNASKDSAEKRKVLTEAVKTIQDVLSAKQVDRLKQIQLQTLRIQALLMPEVVAALDITNAEQKKLQEIESNHARALQALKKNIDMPLSELKTKARQLGNESMNDAMAVLTPLQCEKFKQMRGPLFDFDKRVPAAKGYGKRKSDAVPEK